MGKPKRKKNPNFALQAPVEPAVSAEEAGLIYSQWQQDIYKFVLDNWGFKPVDADIEKLPHGVLKISNQQYDFFNEVNCVAYAKRALAEKRKLETDVGKKYMKLDGIITRAGKGTGKDFELAFLIMWALMAYHPIKVVCVAPSGSQLKTILWSEVRKWLEWPTCKIKDWYEVTNDTIYFKDPTNGQRISTRQAFGRTATVTAEDETNTLSGLHETNMILIFDECSKIPDAVFDPLANTMSDPNNWAVMMFNPERTTGFAVDCDKGKLRNRYVQLHMDFIETDRLTEEQKANQIERLELKYGGRDTNGFRIYVRGMYPTAEADTFIPWNYAFDAVDRMDYILPESYPIKAGIDVGLLEDKTVVSIFQGPNQIGLEKIGSDIHDNDELKLAEYVLTEVLVPYNVRLVMVELDGIGHAFYTILKRIAAFRKITVRGVNTSSSSKFPDRYYSLREEIWDNFRRQVIEANMKLMKDDDQLIELTKMKKDEGGQFKNKLKLLGNKKIKKEIKRSPDSASATVVAVYANEKPYIKVRDPFMEKYGINAAPDYYNHKSTTYMSA